MWDGLISVPDVAIFGTALYASQVGVCQDVITRTTTFRKIDRELRSSMASEHCCKVDRVRDAYDIRPPSRVSGDLDSYLLERWKGEGGNDPVGVRTLSEWFNKRVLQSVYRTNGRADSSVRLDADYEALRGDDIPEHERAELLSELSEDDIDGDAVTTDFIGKSTLSRHLKQCLDASKDTPVSSSNWEIDRIRVATRTYRSHLESALQSLGNKDEIAGVGEAELQVGASLSCPHCPTRVTVETAYAQGYVCADHRDDTA